MEKSIDVQVIEKVEALAKKASVIEKPIYKSESGEEFFSGSGMRVAKTYIDDFKVIRFTETNKRVAVTFKDPKGVERFTSNNERVADTYTDEKDILRYSKTNEEVSPKIYRKTIETQSLQSIIDYIEAGIELNGNEELFVVVHDINKVSLYVKSDEKGKRELLFRSELSDQLKQFPYDRYIEGEDFVVGLHSLFVQDGRDIVQAIQKASSLSLTESVNSQDSNGGFKHGVTSEVETGVQAHIFNLAPFRTFREIKQPESMFVFRTKQDLRCALFEADGGYWRIEAMNSIKEWLRAKLPKLSIIG